MRLLSSHGEIVKGRCGATNLCAYCAKLAAVENAELLALDALAGSAPEVWACLTTREATTDTRRFYESRRQVLRALRRRWPEVEYAALVEFTTGYGANAGGRRRPHWNLLLKGIPRDDVDQVAEVIRAVWCSREDARPEAQHVGAVGEFGGLMRYIALHFQKESQRPPEGWRGWRFLKSRGYLATTTPEAREAARRSLRHKRELWRAIGRGLTGLEAEAAARRAIELADTTTWRMLDVTAALTAATRSGGAGPLPDASEGRRAALRAPVAQPAGCTEADSVGSPVAGAAAALELADHGGVTTATLLPSEPRVPPEPRVRCELPPTTPSPPDLSTRPPQGAAG